MSTDEKIKEGVRRRYGEIAAGVLTQGGQASGCGPPPPASSCCGSDQAGVDELSTAARLYAAEEVGDLPDSVTGASLGCGNPTALADLRPGETVLDLGSGGGIDCFLAAKQVGPEGRVIGLDMTPEMIKLARQNAKKVGLTNVDFRYGEMEDMPIADETVDVIISNCVINLSPDKDAVFGEAYRVLKPGGRLVVSDMVTNGPLPDVVRQSAEAWAACVAGALDEASYLDKIGAAGFTEVQVTGRDYVDPEIIAASPDVTGFLAGLGESVSVGELAQAMRHKVASIKVVARKP